MKKIIILLLLLSFSLFLNACSFNDKTSKTQTEEDNVFIKNHTITLVDDYGYSEKVYVDDGKALKISHEPSKKNYIFTGWYTDKSHSTLYDFTRPVKNNFTLYAGYTLSYTSKSIKDFRIKSSISENSSASYNITPYNFDLEYLKKQGYGIKITVIYSYYYVKDYDVLLDIGYAGSPKFEFSIFNTDGVGYFENDLPTKKETQTETYSVVSDISFINNKDMFLKFSTDNIQNLIYFKNITVNIEAVKVR